MKIIISLLGIQFLTLGSAFACVDLNGIFQTNFPQEHIEDSSFNKYSQSQCKSLTIARDGYWDVVTKSPTFRRGSRANYRLDGVKHCALGFCYTAKADDLKVSIQFSPSYDEKGEHCESGELQLSIHADSSIIEKYIYTQCKNGSNSIKELVYPRYN